MTKEYKYKVVRIYSTYSKKKGSITKKHLLYKNLSLKEAVEKVNQEYPNTNIQLSKDLSIQTSGFIYPDTIKIVRQSKNKLND